MPKTSPNVHRFSKLFHYQTHKQTHNETVIKDLTTPQMHRYTTLWNVDVRKLQTIWKNAKWQTARFQFTHRPKISIFAVRPTGATHCTNLCEIWDSRGAHGSTWLSKISRHSVPGWERGPKMVKISTFGEESPCAQVKLDQFLQFLGAFICPTTLH